MLVNILKEGHTYHTSSMKETNHIAVVLNLLILKVANSFESLCIFVCGPIYVRVFV